MSKKIIFILILIVLLLGAGFLAFKYFSPYGASRSQVPGLTKKVDLSQIPEAPKEKVSVYKGFWEPVLFIDESWQSVTDEKLLKEVGANIISFGPTVKINARGETQYSGSFRSINDIEKRLAILAKRYYGVDIRISLAIETFYEEKFTMFGGGEPKPFSQEIVSQPGFLNQYNQVVEEMAKLAEKYQVEIFSPMNEPDYKLGTKLASDWGQEILPRVKKHYQGKILWKAAGMGLMGGGPMGQKEEDWDVNFKGYDIIGIDPTPGGGPIEGYRRELGQLLDKLDVFAKRDSVSEIMLTEFGAWGGAINFDEETKALAHRIAFEVGQGRGVTGFFALDPPSDLDRPLKGTKSLEEIKLWFTQKLD